MAEAPVRRSCQPADRKDDTKLTDQGQPLRPSPAKVAGGDETSNLHNRLSQWKVASDELTTGPTAGPPKVASAKIAIAPPRFSASQKSAVGQEIRTACQVDGHRLTS